MTMKNFLTNANRILSAMPEFYVAMTMMNIRSLHFNSKLILI